MNFKISKKEFLDALTMSVRAISNTTPLPSLSGIKIEVRDNSLVLISSDSNISIRTAINNNDTNTLIINETGEIIIDARNLLEIVRRIDSDFINFELIDGTLVKIYGGNSEFKVNGMKASEYPNINFETECDTPFKLSTDLFKEIIDQTIFACSDKETRPVLTGVNFKANDGKMTINATDSYRLATKTIEIGSEQNFNITVPAKYLSEVIHSIGNEKEIVVAISPQKISFIFGNSIIDARLLDDTFPDTSRLIPANFNQTLKLEARNLVTAIDRNSFIKSDGRNVVRLAISGNTLEITAANQLSQSYEEIPVISFEGNPLEISCSGKYMIDAIKAIDSEEIIIKFSGELKPLIIIKENDENLIQLISPVRTYH
ncbi:MAG: DNA polymerase III subunit beta [Firmicutes bacterium]|nr:DNA polymerase III subunit beta [Candidatus Colivicinus equi]